MIDRTACRSAAYSLALGALLALAAQAAHPAAVPVSTSPARYAALIHSPHVIRLRFSEAIVVKSSSVRLTDVSGRQVRITPVKVRGNDSLEVKVGRLDAGVYMVHWTSVSAVDGSKATGSYQFTVQ